MDRNKVIRKFIRKYVKKGVGVIMNDKPPYAMMHSAGAWSITTGFYAVEDCVRLSTTLLVNVPRSRFLSSLQLVNKINYMLEGEGRLYLDEERQFVFEQAVFCYGTGNLSEQLKLGVERAEQMITCHQFVIEEVLTPLDGPEYLVFDDDM